jgi:hypothetical protein
MKTLMRLGLLALDLALWLPLGADPTLPLAQRAEERAKIIRGSRVLPPERPAAQFRNAAE